jgi:4-hydroxy-tetrahydrodipicolinate synthase
MAESGKFQFLKDTCCNPTKIKAKLDAVKGTNLKIYNANSAMLLETLYMGCAGFSGIMANFFPELFAEMCNCYETDPEKAKKIQDFVGFSSMAEGQCYPINSKYFLQLEGLDINLDSRSRDKNDFSLNTQECTREMRNAAAFFKANL